MFFISDAFADAGSSQSAGFMGFLPIIACVAILYFLLIRPQQKRQKQHQELIASIKKGDKVVTNGGRVLGVTAIGNDLVEARANAYKATELIDFDNKYMRHDIGKAIDER